MKIFPSYIYFSTLSILCMLFSCSPPPPEAAFIIEKLKGSYCANGETEYRLILKDSTYYSIRRSPGILQTQTKVRESCKGVYRLIFEENTWIIRFESDPNPQAVVETCEQEYLVWNAKDGFIIGEETLTLRELFDQVPVTRAACDTW
ncbi:MAG: hypothetical protein AAF694_12260 [Bacteroidota bacterium]